MIKRPIEVRGLNHESFRYRIRYGEEQSHSGGSRRLENDELIMSEPCRRFCDHWESLKGDGGVPHTSEFLNQHDPQLISSVYILEITDGGPLIRFMGTELVDLIGKDLTNTIFGDRLSPDLLAGVTANCEAVVSHPCGLNEITEFASAVGRPLKLETVMLPLEVDAGRPPRLCSFSHLIEAPAEDDRSDLRFQANRRYAWFDIGAGVPSELPTTSSA